jgi:NADPH:quinone reductase-like Zn-dependent oxidoreductase
MLIRAAPLFARPDERQLVKPVVDRRYELSQAAEALRYLGEGHARGKVVISIPSRA